MVEPRTKRSISPQSRGGWQKSYEINMDHPIENPSSNSLPPKPEQRNAKYAYISLLFVIVLIGTLFTIAMSMYSERQKENTITDLEIKNKTSTEKAEVLAGTYDEDILVIKAKDMANGTGTERARFKIEIADTPALQELGLSGRKDLSADHALLFVFEKDGHYAFWMKEMNFSIDMIWINKDKKIVHIVEHAKPESYPQTFQSSEPARYVLEVRDGIVHEKNIAVGDTIRF